MNDTLARAKPSGIEHILNTFNTFDSQVQFTADKFCDNDIHFLDIQMHGTAVYRKGRGFIGCPKGRNRDIKFVN